MLYEKDKEVAFMPVTLDFITLGVEFCVMLESEDTSERDIWIDKMLKILPLLYVKATLIPKVEMKNEEEPEIFVKENDYTWVENKVSRIMGEENIYLDVFVEDMKYSDSPISAFVSENFADIYQDIRNLISIYQHDLKEQANDALFICIENFKNYWGQKLLNVLRPLHTILHDGDNDNTLSNNYLTEEGLWD